MENPFETLNQRLETIEEKLTDLVQLIESGSSAEKNTWVTTKQLAEHLGVSTATITNMRGSKFPYYKVGGKILFKKQEVEEVLESTRHKTGGEHLDDYLRRNQVNR